MKLTVRLVAGEHERFMPGAFDPLVGTTVPVTVAGHAGRALVTAAVIASDGTWAEVTLDDDDQPGRPAAAVWPPPAEQR